MAPRKKKPVYVIVDRSFEYRMNAAQRRTLPVGWRGFVEADLAEQMMATTPPSAHEAKPPAGDKPAADGKTTKDDSAGTDSAADAEG